MKLERMLAIITYLLNREKVKADKGKHIPGTRLVMPG